jgi:hypothetical protein
MPVTDGTNRFRRLDWVLGGLTVAAILSTVLGHRFSGLVVENVGFVVLLMLAVLFLVMSWWRFVRALISGRADRWRAWVSLAGCIALTLAFALPLIPFFFIVLRWGFGPRWDFKLLMLCFSLGSLLAGTLAARRVRFPLVAGGFIIVIVALILPQGV